MKNAGADGAWYAMDLSTNLALAQGLIQNGVKMKAQLMATGYGHELLEQPVAKTLGPDIIFDHRLGAGRAEDQGDEALPGRPREVRRLHQGARLRDLHRLHRLRHGHHGAEEAGRRPRPVDVLGSAAFGRDVQRRRRARLHRLEPEPRDLRQDRVGRRDQRSAHLHVGAPGEGRQVRRAEAQGFEHELLDRRAHRGVRRPAVHRDRHVCRDEVSAPRAEQVQSSPTSSTAWFTQTSESRIVASWTCRTPSSGSRWRGGARPTTAGGGCEDPSPGRPRHRHLVGGQRGRIDVAQHVQLTSDSCSRSSAGKLFATHPHSAASLPVIELPVSWMYFACAIVIFHGKIGTSGESRATAVAEAGVVGDEAMSAIDMSSRPPARQLPCTCTHRRGGPRGSSSRGRPAANWSVHAEPGSPTQPVCSF